MYSLVFLKCMVSCTEEFSNIIYCVFCIDVSSKFNQTDMSSDTIDSLF